MDASDSRSYYRLGKCQEQLQSTQGTSLEGASNFSFAKAPSFGLFLDSNKTKKKIHT